VAGVKSSVDVVTLTPSPCLDMTYELDGLTLGGVHRSPRVRSEFAGKGVNVTRALALAGTSSRAVVPLSRSDHQRVQGDELIITSPIEGTVRVCVTITEEGGRTTKINQSAPALCPEEWENLLALTVDTVAKHSSPWLLIAGTVPLSTDGSLLSLEPLFTQAQSHGCQVALDTSGEALQVAARSGLPALIKPNAEELAECVGRSLLTLGDVIEAGQEVVSWGVDHVIVSLGPDGIVGVSRDHHVHAWTDPVEVRNTIGAGDASVAGFLNHIGKHPQDLAGAMAHAVAWGAQKVQQAGSQLQTLTALPQSHVTEQPERTRVLQAPGR